MKRDHKRILPGWARAGLSAAAAFALAAGTAQAQSRTEANAAWIGQTGGTNAITITQTGSANAAGNDAAQLRLNQLGRFNAITIDQFGYANEAATLPVTDADAPQGIGQQGDRNELTVEQRNSRADGSNSVGAVLQQSGFGIAARANALAVLQDDGAGDGAAGHRVGFASQRNTGADAGENGIRISQTGGLDGLGNEIGRLVQAGYPNTLETFQSFGGNAVATLRQIGALNRGAVTQAGGENNTVGLADQAGSRNRMAIAQSGGRNAVARAYQNNEGLAASGNRIAATFAGDGNGGDGFGGLGLFRSAVASATGAFQGVLSQIGDGNDIRYAVTGGVESLFGISQEGDGNGTAVSVSALSAAGWAARNEAAFAQIGDGNALSLAVMGDDNAAGAVMWGERNAVTLAQLGIANTLSIVMDGNDNNSGAFRARTTLLAPGQMFQSGSLNRGEMRVSGDNNRFALSQDGEANAASLAVVGFLNQAVVIQNGRLNTSLVRQTGSGNFALVRQ